MSKAGSKNNAALREKAKEYLYNGKKIKPTKLISAQGSFMGAEYDDSGDVVIDVAGNPLSWAQVITIASTN